MPGAPDAVKKLVDTFAEHVDHYKSAGYNETEVRREFLDPLWKALGWDIDNRRGYADAYKEVIHEDSIRVGTQIKAPDYSFRIGGQRKFFLEAKKPAVNIKGDTAPAYQLRRYAWSAKLPLSVLSDFEEFSAYDCRYRPTPVDPASKGRTLYFTYDQYEDHWEEIEGIFSREAILHGSFDKYVDDNKRKRGTTEVDAAFLTEIERWREVLAKNLVLRNGDLSIRDLNYAVQKIIDRIIFLRICEDRGTEDYGRLRKIAEGDATADGLFELFRQADLRYNSGLFHFTGEKDRPGAPDTLTPGLTIDDKVIRDIVTHLYYPDSPYAFTVLPADILGQVYEQFLGKTIEIGGGEIRKTVRIEQKPEVRKAGGVYYTPTYIVDYIVENTLGRLLDGDDPENPKPIPVSHAEKLKIVDPACGSGSFLIVAYQYLLDWHRDQYTLDPEAEPESADALDQGKIKRHAGGKSPKIYQAADGEWKLTTAERKRILLNNIHGVDIDSQAVEVTKLSLLLKVLEGETEQVVERDWIKERERILPDLGANIQCGNSLIGPDFYAQPDLPELDDETRYRINVFDWEAAFPEVFEQGGFDCVIGNPPWGADITGPVTKYLASHYRRVIDRMVDTYVYFIDKTLRVLISGGNYGLVIPSTILNQSDTLSVRKLVALNGIEQLINLGQGIFGRGAKNTTTLLIGRKEYKSDHPYFLDIQHDSVGEKKAHLNDGTRFSFDDWIALAEADAHFTFFISDIEGARLLAKLSKSFDPFRKIIDGKIQRGVTPDCAEMHLIPDEEKTENECNLIRRSLSGKLIKRFHTPGGDHSIIYTTRHSKIEDYPKIIDRMAAYRNRITCKEVSGGKHPWWSLHRPRKLSIFDSPKFIGVTTSRKIEVIPDLEENLVVTDACYVFTVRKYAHQFVLGVIHSNLFLWMYRVSNQGDGRVIPQVKAAKLGELPFRQLDFRNPEDVAKHSRMVALVDTMLALHRQQAEETNPDTLRQIENQITATDRQIDRLVYDLYDLTEDEIALVEASA